jgi:hypothetical protein
VNASAAAKNKRNENKCSRKDAWRAAEFSNAWSNGQGERGAGRKSGSIVQERKQGMREQGEGNTIQEGEQGTTGGSMEQEGE